jgi:hypothetical protein
MSDPLKQAAETVAGKIDLDMKAKPKRAEVVPIKR